MFLSFITSFIDDSFLLCSQVDILLYLTSVGWIFFRAKNTPNWVTAFCITLMLIIYVQIESLWLIHQGGPFLYESNWTVNILPTPLKIVHLDPQKLLSKFEINPTYLREDCPIHIFSHREALLLMNSSRFWFGDSPKRRNYSLRDLFFIQNRKSYT